MKWAIVFNIHYIDLTIQLNHQGKEPYCVQISHQHHQAKRMEPNSHQELKHKGCGEISQIKMLTRIKTSHTTKTLNIKKDP